MSVGMGRGRGRLPQQLNGDVEPLRRPNIANVGRGRPNQPATSAGPKPKFIAIEAALSDPRVDSMILFKALDDFLQDNPSNEDIEFVVDKIFEIVTSSKTNCDCICKCIYLASKHKTKGEQLYITFFNHLEKRFTGVNQIKETNGVPGVWRFQLFFSCVAQFVRNQKVAPMTELMEGLKTLCLDSPQPTCSEEAKISAISIARCVYYMKLSNKSSSQIDTVISKLRGSLHRCSQSAITDPNMVLWFALGLETCVHGNSKLPDETVQYYCRILGPEAAMFNLVPHPPLNLPKTAQSSFNFSDISYVLNFI